MKASRQDADDDVGSVVQRHGLAENAGPSTEALLPGGITQEDRALGCREILAFAKVATHRRRHTERAKEIIADASGRYAFDTVATGQRRAAPLVGGERREDGIELLPVEVIQIREVRLRKDLNL